MIKTSEHYTDCCDLYLSSRQLSSKIINPQKRFRDMRQKGLPSQVETLNLRHIFCLVKRAAHSHPRPLNLQGAEIFILDLTLSKTSLLTKSKNFSTNFMLYLSTFNFLFNNCNLQWIPHQASDLSKNMAKMSGRLKESSKNVFAKLADTE